MLRKILVKIKIEMIHHTHCEHKSILQPKQKKVNKSRVHLLLPFRMVYLGVRQMEVVYYFSPSEPLKIDTSALKVFMKYMTHAILV